MAAGLVTLLTFLLLAGPGLPAEAQLLGPVFKRVNPSVVVIRTKEREVAGHGRGFVVTSNMAQRLLLERQSFWSGLSGTALSGDLAKVFNLPQPVGLLVERVAERSPSAAVGLRAGTMKATIDGKTLTVGGDIILEVQGIPIEDSTSYEQIQERLGLLHPGAPITITVLREGRQVELKARLP